MAQIYETMALYTYGLCVKIRLMFASSPPTRPRNVPLEWALLDRYLWGFRWATAIPVPFDLAAWWFAICQLLSIRALSPICLPNILVLWLTKHHVPHSINPILCHCVAVAHLLTTFLFTVCTSCVIAMSTNWFSLPNVLISMNAAIDCCLLSDSRLNNAHTIRNTLVGGRTFQFCQMILFEVRLFSLTFRKFKTC